MADDTPQAAGYVPASEAAYRGGISTRTLHRWVAAGDVDTMWYAGRRWFCLQDVLTRAQDRSGAVLKEAD